MGSLEHRISGWRVGEGKHQGRLELRGWDQHTMGNSPEAWSEVGYLGHTAQGLCVTQVGTGPSQGLGAQDVGEAQDLGWDTGG